MKLPLAGVRVIELAQNLAGPYAGEILAMLGADVTKIERPGSGDDARAWGPPFHDGAATPFQAVNRNKRSVVMDLKDPVHVARLKDLIADADIVVQNMRPGALDAAGLSAASLRARHPRLIYCSLWAYGAKGPMKMEAGYELTIQAFAGMFAINGSEEGPPSRIGLNLLDMGTGMWGAMGCLAALHRRNETGEGGLIDASLLETSLAWMSLQVAQYSSTGVVPARDRMGASRAVVFAAFQAADKELAIAAGNDRLFAKLAEALGHPEWVADPKYSTNAARLKNRPELHAHIGGIIVREPVAHWEDVLGRAGVPCSAINDIRIIDDDPQIAALGILAAPPGSDLRLVGFPMSIDGERPAATRASPRLGADTLEVMGNPA